jgi:hypothetical protein
MVDDQALVIIGELVGLGVALEKFDDAPGHAVLNIFMRIPHERTTNRAAAPAGMFQDGQDTSPGFALSGIRDENVNHRGRIHKTGLGWSQLNVKIC